jgi:hypothetical protein
MPSEQGVPKVRPAQGNMGTYFGITLLRSHGSEGGGIVYVPHGPSDV